MNLTTTLFYIDRNLTQEQLVAGVAKALGVRSDLIAILDLTQQDSLPAGWFEETDAVAVQMNSMRGDFPVEVSIASRAAFDYSAGGSELEISDFPGAWWASRRAIVAHLCRTWKPPHRMQKLRWRRDEYF